MKIERVGMKRGVFWQPLLLLLVLLIQDATGLEPQRQIGDGFRDVQGSIHLSYLDLFDERRSLLNDR